MCFSDEFPVLGQYNYLNTANSGLLSRDIAVWRTNHDQEFIKTGSLFRLKENELIEYGRKLIASFFNAYKARIFLVPNFSHAFNIFINGLDKQKRFVLIKNDYPSITYSVQSRGHQCTFVEADEFLEQHILEAVKKSSPDILAISIVQYTDGMMIDFQFLKKLKFDYPELLIVADGTQFCGTLKFDFDNSGIDILISSGYKWLLGGYGNGFVIISPQAACKLYSKQKTVTLPAEDFLKGKDKLSLYFEPGHLDTLSFGTLFKALDYLNIQGVDNIQKKISGLSEQAKQAFAARGLLSDAIMNRQNHSSIFKLNLSDATITRLLDNKIIATSIGAGLRVSFHFYNSEDNLKNLLQLLDL